MGKEHQPSRETGNEIARGTPASAHAPARSTAPPADSPRQASQRQAVQRLMQASAPAAPQAAEGGLPADLRTGLESLSGVSMEGVRVHYNSSRPAGLNAHAYAQGDDIHLASGQEQHLPHEAWHVVQQKQGRVKATTSVGGAAVNDSPALEQEADRMGASALHSGSALQRKALASPQATTSGVRQLMARWYEKQGDQYVARMVGLPSFTGWQKLDETHEGKDVYVNVGWLSAESDESFKDWCYRNRVVLIALGVLVLTGAAYLLYRKYGGTGPQTADSGGHTPTTPSTSTPDVQGGGGQGEQVSVSTPQSQVKPTVELPGAETEVAKVPEVTKVPEVAKTPEVVDAPKRPSFDVSHDTEISGKRISLGGVKVEKQITENVGVYGKGGSASLDYELDPERRSFNLGAQASAREVGMQVGPVKVGVSAGVGGGVHSTVNEEGVRRTGADIGPLSFDYTHATKELPKEVPKGT